MLNTFEYKHIKTQGITGRLGTVKPPESIVSIQVHEDEILVHLCCPEAWEVFDLQNGDRTEPSSCANI